MAQEKQLAIKSAKSKNLLKHYDAIIEKACKNPSKLNILLNYIKRYIDKNNETLFAQAPLEKILFTPADQNIFVEFIDKDPSTFTHEFVQVMEETYRKNSEYKWVMAVHLLKFPFSFLTIAVARRLYLMNKKNEADLILVYLAIKSYSAIIHLLFPLAIKKEVMLYTVNTLSNRYKYTKLQSNFNVIKDTVLGVVSSYYKAYMDFDDGVYPTFFNQIFNRLKNNYKLIASNYYDNNASRRYLNTVKTSDDETNSQIDMEDSGGLIEGIADAATNNFMTKMPSLAIIKDIAKQSDISYISLLQCIEECRKNHSANDIKTLFRAIVTLVYDSDHSILSRVRSKEFIITARRQISVATSHNPSLQIVKDESEKILSKYCSKFVQTNRPATKTQYRQALYYYMVYIIVASK